MAHYFGFPATSRRNGRVCCTAASDQEPTLWSALRQKLSVEECPGWVNRVVLTARRPLPVHLSGHFQCPSACPKGARKRHGTSRMSLPKAKAARRRLLNSNLMIADHRLALSSHNTISCNRVWATWAIIVVRQRMPAAVLTAGREQLAVVGLFGPRRVRPRTLAASPCRPR